jgi:hypothetical protein
MVWSLINILITAGIGAIRITKIKNGAGSVDEKKVRVRAELEKVCGAMEAYAKKTDPTWDDSVVDLLSGQLEIIADLIVGE